MHWKKRHAWIQLRHQQPHPVKASLQHLLQRETQRHCLAAPSHLPLRRDNAVRSSAPDPSLSSPSPKEPWN